MLCKHYELVNTDCRLRVTLCVADMVLDHQEASHELDDSVRVRVREALLKRHHHQNEKKKNLIPIVRSIAEGARKPSDAHGLGVFLPSYFIHFNQSTILLNI